MEARGDIAMVGLGVMGQNLILNMADHGYTVVAYNKVGVQVGDFLNLAAKGYDNILGARSIEEMVGLLKRPRKIFLMVKAGDVLDDNIAQIMPFLDKGDLIIDGGNSNFMDTVRHVKACADKGLLYIGAGVSGGEQGARFGPSIMPGGDPAAWNLVKDLFSAICAKTPDGQPCCEWMGEGGAGHYVKMVHNGIEYGDMQLICEAYQLLKTGLGLSNAEMHRTFAAWNEGELDSYLVEITCDILACEDNKGELVVDKILDAAGQKGTGKWTTTSSLDLGVPVTLISEAVFARCLSALKEERVIASGILKGPDGRITEDRAAFIESIREALLAAKIVSYAQGFMLMREAAKEYKWTLNYGGVARAWRGGCIIRSAFLGKIGEAFDRAPGLQNLLIDSYFTGVLARCQNSWRRVVAQAALAGIPIPTFSSALAFYDGYRSEKLPANLLQAQRDYFGAHTYERVDAPRGKFFHTDWTGKSETSPTASA